MDDDDPDSSQKDSLVSNRVLKQLLLNYLTPKARENTDVLYARQAYLAAWLSGHYSM